MKKEGAVSSRYIAGRSSKKRKTTIQFSILEVADDLSYRE